MRMRIFLDLQLKGCRVNRVIYFVNQIKTIYTSKESLIGNPKVWVYIHLLDSETFRVQFTQALIESPYVTDISMC